jgi:hypothetical protein
MAACSQARAWRNVRDGSLLRPQHFRKPIKVEAAKILKALPLGGDDVGAKEIAGRLATLWYQPFRCAGSIPVVNAVCSKAPDDFRILFLGEVTQVSLRFKITKRIEYHGLASRR